jgi:hypothetical protein
MVTVGPFLCTWQVMVAAMVLPSTLLPAQSRVGLP